MGVGLNVQARARRLIVEVGAEVNLRAGQGSFVSDRFDTTDPDLIYVAPRGGLTLTVTPRARNHQFSSPPWLNSLG